MSEEVKDFFKVVGAFLTLPMAAWIWYFIKDKYKSMIDVDSSHSKRIREIEDNVNILRGTLGSVGKTLTKEFIEIKNEIHYVANTGNEDLTRIKSELTKMHLDIIELRKFVQRHEHGLAVAHKLFKKHASDLAFIHKEHIKKLP